MVDIQETPGESPKFDFSAFSPDTLFYDRRTGLEGQASRPEATAPPRVKKERRRRIDPTTFEKQYTPDELEFMTAMQHFKVQSGKPFPTHGEVLAVARSLGYQKPEYLEEEGDEFALDTDLALDR